MTPRAPVRPRVQLRGSTLLEVALAVAMMAVSGMGLVATQLSLSRHTQSTAIRGQAAFIADAFAEMAVEGGSGVGAGEQWKTRASVAIPGSIVSTDAGGGYASSSTVSWPAKRYGLASADAGALLPCGVTPAAPYRECVSLLFAR